MEKLLRKINEIQHLINDITTNETYSNEIQGKLSLMNVECVEAIKAVEKEMMQK